MQSSFYPPPFDPDKQTFHSPEMKDIVDEAVTFFINTPVHVFPPPYKFFGPGVYAIYYVGKTGIYADLGRRNQRRVATPIYIGQVSSSGVRKGQVTDVEEDLTKRRLLDRLQEHARSIRQANDEENLSIADFRCRFIILQGAEAGLSRVVETELIKRFRPLWNTYIDGFGIHAPGGGRYDQLHSEWDSLHPGRPFLAKMRSGPQRVEPIRAKIQQVLMELAETEEKD